MLKKTRFLLLIYFACMVSLFSQDQLYWTNAGNFSLYRANVDGTGVEDLSNGVSHGFALTGDIDDEFLFWSGLNYIRRSDFIGTAQVTLTNDYGSIYGMDVDAGQNKLYFTDINDHIYRCNYDGSDITVVLQTDAPENIGLDTENNTIYWTAWRGNTVGIFRADLDGSNIDTLVDTDIGRPWSMKLDLINQKLYWSDQLQDQISRIDLDGQNRELLHPDMEGVTGLAVDGVNNILYWSNADNFKYFIQKASTTNFGQIDTLFTEADGLSKPESLFFVPATIDNTNDLLSEEELGIFISPNPARNTLKVESIIPFDNIKLWGTHGQLLETYATPLSLAYNIDISEKPTGIYFLSIRFENKHILTKKIVITAND